MANNKDFIDDISGKVLNRELTLKARLEQLAEGKKFLGHHGTHDMLAQVVLIRLAGSVAKPTRVQSRATRLKRFPEDVSRAVVFNWGDHSFHSIGPVTEHKQENRFHA